ncbi:random slug protein 5 [Gossypium australe]|uniref:Random slug protein 5 n=1 Tax=Gossypium australe TaxID=47621 RepID=A0A5B6VFS4_9ROSI|nr:random slug protein 5 [Gossypium australe]
MDKEKRLKQTQEEEEEMEFKDCENHGQQAQQQQEEEEEEEKIEIGDEIIRSKIGIMRALAERDDPSVKEVDDFVIRRFLRARDLDIEKANTMLLKYLSWRRTFLPKGFVSESEISNQLADNKLCMQGVDKQGRPIVVAFGGRHKPTKGNLEEVKRMVMLLFLLHFSIHFFWNFCFVVYGLEKICARMPRGQEKFVAIGDLEGWGYSNSDIRAYVASLSILQDCYPERLAKLFIVHVPYIFMTAWKVVYPFIDSRTKKKIIFVENKKLKSTLLNDIDESQLADIYGGKLPLVPIENC